MRLRAPSYPLITVDPYFSVWSPADRLTDVDTTHWTGTPNCFCGTVTVDGKTYRFMGADHGENLPVFAQASVDMDALSTRYVFRDAGIELTLTFTTPLLLNDLHLVSRPVSFLRMEQKTVDSHRHTVSVSLGVSEEICMDKRGKDEVVTGACLFGGKYPTVSMGRKNPEKLGRDGDDLRIEWGTFYLTAADAEAKTSVLTADGMTFVSVCAELKKDLLLAFAYDDEESLIYFGNPVKAYWKAAGRTIEEETVIAIRDYKAVAAKCDAFATKMFCDAVRAGGEKYAELCELAYRQTIAAHKLATDGNGELIFVSKECYSNGCAATVDVSYPSIPLFLLYAPELVKAMMRPIYRFARSDGWEYDFAPHDAGRYPILNGQVYGLKEGKLLFEKQMPVEECGNMIVMDTAAALASGDFSFVKEHMDLLDGWVKYLIDNGRDPENQLCTDDFAGHLAHNCNLSLKAIMGIASYGILKEKLGEKRTGASYVRLARDMAKDWAVRAANGDGSYRLAFDAPGSFSMKYNIVWDGLFGTGVMAPEVIQSEVASYFRREDGYGLPLDNRKHYTKSDWLVWTATLANDRDEFASLIAPMWKAFDCMDSRVPMTDWYWTDKGSHKAYVSKSRECEIEKSFRNRTVQGGIFMKLLAFKDILKK